MFAWCVSELARHCEALAHLPRVEEKKMFLGVTFMINGKMCMNISGEELMCRFDPALHETISEKNGFRTMIMKGREYKVFGYVTQDAIKSKRDFDFWINLCLEFNSKAKASKKVKKPMKKTAKKTTTKVAKKKK
ncbi:MAG TPA: TfoX/Sxy family protein [Chryseolinea sp.]|nr:TfoX/Sxy family protein [Chryseolinea sp.]